MDFRACKGLAGFIVLFYKALPHRHLLRGRGLAATLWSFGFLAEWCAPGTQSWAGGSAGYVFTDQAMQARVPPKRTAGWQASRVAVARPVVGLEAAYTDVPLLADSA